MRREYFASRLHVGSVMALLLVLMLACVVLLVGTGLRSPDVARNDLQDEVVRVVVIAASLFFGVMMLGYAPLLVSREPRLVIDDEGLFEGGFGAFRGRIRFTDMREVRVFVGQVGVRLVDVDAYLVDAPFARRFEVRLNQLFRAPHVTMYLFAPLGVRTADVVAEIARAKAAATPAEAEPDGARP